MAELSVIAGKEVSKSNIAEALALDITEYPQAYHLTLQTCFDYFDKNNNIYIMLLDGVSVVGYINFSSVTESTYEKMRTGLMLDVEIPSSEIVNYDKSGLYDAYLSSILLKREYRGKRYSTLMLQKLAEVLCELAERGIFIRRIVADVISKVGGIVCSKFGFKQIGESNHSSRIFEMRLLPPDYEITELNNKIFEAYSKMGGL